MALAADTYVTIADLLAQLAQEQQRLKTTPFPMKLAFCFAGGGARGAYHGGVLEGMLQELKQRNLALAPDILVGTSVGAIVAYAHWIDRMYPTTPIPGAFASRQSGLWQLLARGNHAASTLFEPACLVEYATRQKKIPLLSDTLALVQQLQTHWDALRPDLLALGTAVRTVRADVETSFAPLVDHLGAGLANTLQALSSIGTSLQTLQSDLASRRVAALIGDMAGIVGSALTTVSSATATVNTARSDLTALDQRLAQARTDGTTAATAAGHLVTDAGIVVGSAAILAAEIAAVITAVTLVLEMAGLFFVAGGGVTVGGAIAVGAARLGEAALSDHMLDPKKLRNVLLTYLTSAKGIPALSSSPEESVRKDWLQRPGQKVPELYVTGADITAARLTVFGMGRPDSLKTLARPNGRYSVVDLAGTATSATSSLMSPSNMPEPLVEAVITSTAIPVAFPPRTWTLHRPSSPAGHASVIRHVFVDGGVMDNSPIDIALQAGATHIVSFELTPLLDFSLGGLDVDPKSRNMIDAYTDSFDASRDRALNAQVVEQVEQNRGRGITLNVVRTQVPIYRIAPLGPGAIRQGEGFIPNERIDFLDFNGHYDNNHRLVMNLEDWFMQGYQDARLLASAATATALDPVFKAYATGVPGSGATGKVDFSKANKAWAAVTAAFPVTPP